jgi:hypothetical protein
MIRSALLVTASAALSLVLFGALSCVAAGWVP